MQKSTPALQADFSALEIDVKLYWHWYWHWYWYWYLYVDIIQLDISMNIMKLGHWMILTFLISKTLQGWRVSSHIVCYRHAPFFKRCNIFRDLSRICPQDDLFQMHEPFQNCIQQSCAMLSNLANQSTSLFSCGGQASLASQAAKKKGHRQWKCRCRMNCINLWRFV